MNFIRFTWWILTLFAKDSGLPPTRRFLHPHPIKLSNDHVTLFGHPCADGIDTCHFPADLRADTLFTMSFLFLCHETGTVPHRVSSICQVPVWRWHGAEPLPTRDGHAMWEGNFFIWRPLSFGGRLLLQQKLAYGKLTQDLALMHSGSNGEDMINREELCW